MKSLLLITLLALPAQAAHYVHVDRYTKVLPQPTSFEVDPLSINVQLTFPPTVQTVGEAVNFVLFNSGWMLTDGRATDTALNIMLERPLPLVHRTLSLMSVRDVLQVLVGQHFTPVEDPIRRIYSFDLKQEYRGLVNE